MTTNNDKRARKASTAAKGRVNRADRLEAAARAAASESARRQRRTVIVVTVGVVVVVLVAAVIAVTSGGGKKAPVAQPTSSSDAPTVISQVTSVPQTVSDQIGKGAAQSLPKPINSTAITSAGKPEVLYIGAEYCPYCATERWAMVVALARFGTFTNLSLTHSSSTDVFANTPTFTFHGSTYTSPYLTFTPVETETNTPDGHGGYTRLDTPTPDQQAVLQSLDSDGGIPFVDLGGRYLINGVGYDPQTLQGKTAVQVAAALSDPTSPVAKGVVGAANGIVAALCKLTNQQPETVCNSPAIQQLQTALG